MSKLNIGDWICFGYKTENETISGVIDLITEDAIYVKMDTDGVPCRFSKDGIFILMNQEANKDIDKEFSQMCYEDTSFNPIP